MLYTRVKKQIEFFVDEKNQTYINSKPVNNYTLTIFDAIDFSAAGDLSFSLSFPSEISMQF